MLKKPCYTYLKGMSVQTSGWMKKQLIAQAEGLGGHLDKVWPDIRDSAWIGGDRDGWERVPYWLDGFVPLAWLLNDDDLKARAKKYIDHIIDSQCEDGWLCPCPVEERKTYDVWALFLILKVLALYADCSGEEERIADVIERALKCLDRSVDAYGIHRWALARWFECLIPIYWLYDRKPMQWLLDLAHKLWGLGADYLKLLRDQPVDVPQDHWNFWRHVVNLAMSIKEGGLTYRLTGEDPSARAKDILAILLKYHGMSIDHFTGDECLSGMGPDRGTELCGVVEAMYSYETLLAISGDSQWGDTLEYLAFNGLATTMSADMWTHQYNQIPNQVRCAPFAPEDNPFRTNPGDSNVFGLEPNFGCCTANFGQGWPKLALAAFLQDEHSLASAVLIPSTVETHIDGSQVRCELQTNYPFSGDLTYVIETDKPVAFDFQIRIPGFAATATVDGSSVKTGCFHTISRQWEGETVIQVRLTFEPKYMDMPYGLSALRVGPILYALPLEETWKRVEYERDGVVRKHPYCDYEVTTNSFFGFAFAGDINEIEQHEGEIGTLPFANEAPASWLSVPMVPIDWRFEQGKCKNNPENPVPIGEKRMMRMIPYGCARLRMTEMPKLFLLS